MKIKIKEIVDIKIGYQFRKKIEPVSNGLYKVIQIRDFDENLQLRYDNLYRVVLDDFPEKHSVSKGDVLFLSRGHKNWAAPILVPLENTLAVSHFFILKIKSDIILPEYLAWYINQPPAQEFLYHNARRGSNIPLVPKSAFENLEIHLPDLATQKKIVELNRLFEKERSLVDELQKKRNILIRSVCLQAAKNNKNYIKEIKDAK